MKEYIFAVDGNEEPYLATGKIVRCEDCKYLEAYSDCYICCLHSDHDDFLTALDAYCAWGERKADNETV